MSAPAPAAAPSVPAAAAPSGSASGEPAACSAEGSAAAAPNGLPNAAGTADGVAAGAAMATGSGREDEPEATVRVETAGDVAASLAAAPLGAGGWYSSPTPLDRMFTPPVIPVSSKW